MTSRADRFEHAVMATELEQANRTGQHPVGLCGVVVDPAPLGATAQHVCRPCRELIGRRQELRAPQPTPWTLLVQWYEALIQLLRSRGAAAQRAIAAPRPVLALPAATVDRPHPAPGAGGRHRRVE